MIKGFKMKLYEGQEAEYEKRHNQLWPEMKDMIHEYGGKNYTIFLDKETLTLFGYIEIEDEERWAKGADTAMVGFHGRYYGNQPGQQPREHRSQRGFPLGLNSRKPRKIGLFPNLEK